MKAFDEITLSDLMAEYLDVSLEKHSKFGFNLQINDQEGETMLIEEGVHPFAAESFADFCRQYLFVYEQAMCERM